MIDRCEFPGCSKESEIGAHGIRDNSVYSEYWCLEHYHSKSQKKTDNALELVRQIARNLDGRTGELFQQH
jgi:hypothetical protein